MILPGRQRAVSPTLITAALAVAVSALGAQQARAADPPVAPAAEPAAAGTAGAPSAQARRVLLVIDAADDPFARRLNAELSALGLTVLTREAWRTGAAVGTLESAARADGAVAAIRTVPSRNGVEVWMADQVTGRPLLRQLVVDENPGGPNQSLVALQTVELLRTSLFPKAAPEPRPAAPPPVVIVAPPPAPPPAPPAPPEMGVTAGVGGLYSPGGSGTALQIWLSLHRTLGRGNRRLEVDLDLSGPARSASLTAGDASTTVQAYLAGLALLARRDIPSVGVVLDAGLGGGALVLASSGSASAPLAGRLETAITGVGYLRAGAAVEAARWLRVGVRGVAGVAAERARIRFATAEVGTWGHLFAGALATFEVCWR